MLPLLLILLLIGVALAALAIQRRAPGLRGVARGLLVSYVTILVILGGAEAYFRYVYADSEGRLALGNWMARHWQTNSLGYRDREWTPTDWQGRRTIALVGDSFTAGWGVPDPADRFGDVLAARLGADAAVFNLGILGSSTPEQQVALERYPVQPDVVVLQYFLNDIEYAALSLGLGMPGPPQPPLATESHLASFLYSRFTGGFGADYWSALYWRYDHAAVWARHRAELEAFTTYTDRIGARLIVVIFPNLQDPLRSVAYVDRVAQVFEAGGHTDILRLYDAVAAWSPAEVIVSPRDAHPSAAFHRYVGDQLYEAYFR